MKPRFFGDEGGGGRVGCAVNPGRHMKRAALLLIHGMGEQLPWEEPDSFIRGLVRRYMSRPDPPPGGATTPDLDAVHLELLMDVSDGMPPPSRPGGRIRITRTRPKA